MKKRNIIYIEPCIISEVTHTSGFGINLSTNEFESLPHPNNPQP